ncbi:hypothetical protein H311_02596 [Anncaliia algerae PRA109]|nr:hypothetical protein H311_02596 [Anncaliia algerae PRA109]
MSSFFCCNFFLFFDNLFHIIINPLNNLCVYPINFVYKLIFMYKVPCVKSCCDNLPQYQCSTVQIYDPATTCTGIIGKIVRDSLLVKKHINARKIPLLCSTIDREYVYF